MPRLRRVLTLRDVVLFNIVAMFGLRSTAPKMGPIAIPLWIVAMLAFLIPHGLSVAELSTRDSGEGGVYRWTRSAFGAPSGFLAGWFYWICNVTYLPSLLTAAVSYGVYVIRRPDLGENVWLVCGVSLCLLWAAAWANVRGLRLGRWITSVGGTSAWVVTALLVGVGAMVALRFGSTTSWQPHGMMAELGGWRSLGYFGTLSFALCGFELASGMGDEVHDPARTLPRAILMAGAILAAMYLLGTIAILVIETPDRVSPISGALGALQTGADRIGLGGIGLLGACLITAAACGGVYAWMAGVARIPFAAGLDRFVPAAFGRLHPRYGTPHVAIYTQSIVVSVIIVASQLGASVREAFLIMVDMTIVMNFVPYLYLFLAVPRLRNAADGSHVVRIPGGAGGLWTVTIVGTATTLLTIAASVVPPPDVTNPLLYEAKMWGGFALFSAAGYWLYRAAARRLGA